jgi:hypothetical protein
MLNLSYVAGKIKSYVELILTFLYKPTLINRCEPSSSTPKWVPPPEGMVFVNVDATIFFFCFYKAYGCRYCCP